MGAPEAHRVGCARQSAERTAALSLRTTTALALGATMAARWSPAAAAVAPEAARVFRIQTRLGAGHGVLLTFDDGPHPQGTPAVLAELERAGAHAVFFVCGEQVERYPAVAREVLSAGHELELHGYRHQTRRHWSRRLLADDTRRALDAIGVATGVTPRLYRPPHGVFSVPGLRLIRTLGLEPLLWSRWGRDWQGRATARSVATTATDGIADGDIVLLHDADHYGARESWRTTAAALPLVFDALERRGLKTAYWPGPVASPFSS